MAGYTEEVNDSKRKEAASYFANAHDFSIARQNNVAEGGTIYMTNITYSHSGDFDVNDKLNPIPDASYMRDRKKSPPNSTCLPGTREVVMKEIRSWINASVVVKKPSHVFWLHGYVGSGKSAIAQTIAETYAKKGRLAASFFFFRGSGDRSKSARFVKTLASDLAAAIPSTVPAMKKAIKDYVGLLTTSPLELQFQHLFLEPFRATLRNPLQLARLVKGPVVTVIDGLDECEDREEVATFMDRMAAFYAEHPRTPLRFFISSRVEEHIRTRILRIGAHTRVQLVNLASHGTEEDMALIVREAFRKAAEEDRIIQSYGDWPTSEERRKLVKLADGSFILISMVLRFILERTNDGRTAKDRLSTALNLSTGLDGAYTAILQQAQEPPYFMMIITTIALINTPLNIYQLAELHHVEVDKIIPVYENLHAVLQVPDDIRRVPVTLCHSSFREYLLTESRSGPFYASPSFHKVLAYRFFELTHLVNVQTGIPPIAHDQQASYSFDRHWEAYLRHCRSGTHELLSEEVTGLIAHFRATHPSASRFTDSLFVTYALLDHDWFKATLGGNGRSSIASVPQFLQPFTAVRDKVGLSSIVMSMFIAVEKTLSALPGDIRRGEQLSILLKALDPPISTLSEARHHHTLLVNCCSPQLFTREGGSGTTIMFLPIRGELLDDLYVSDYAFRCFGLHLSMAIEHDQDFVRSLLFSPNGYWCPNATRRELTPFEYMVHQQRHHPSFRDPGPHFPIFKTNFERAESVVERVLKVLTVTLQERNDVHSDAYSDNWCFISVPKHTKRANFWAYGCMKEDYSLINLWTVSTIS